MRPTPIPEVTRPSRLGRTFTLILALSTLLWGVGCQEINARRSIQEGNKEFEKGRFEQAAQHFEDALKLGPHLAIAHYNAGLTYKKMFRPGFDTPENMAYAKKASEHFQAYLEKHGQDRDIITLLTRVWTESGDHASALAYWEAELSKDPSNTEVIGILAGINRQAGDYDKSVEWYERQVEVEADAHAKAGAYKAIGTLMSSRLRGRNHTIIGDERLAIADQGIGALQKALQLVPDDIDSQTALGFLYGQRALAQSTTWAQMIEVASARHHYKRWSKLNKEAQAKAEAEAAEAAAAAGDDSDDSDESGDKS